MSKKIYGTDQFCKDGDDVDKSTLAKIIIKFYISWPTAKNNPMEP